MCGIFAFTGPAAPHAPTLVAAARKAAQRGPHGHGWAGPGIAHRNLGPLDSAALVRVSAPRLLGHARLATVGPHDNRDGLQPIACDGHLLAHNGTITNYRDLHSNAPTDSVALAAVYAAHRRDGLPPAHALARALQAARQPAWVVVVLDANGEIITHRHGLPLWRHTDDTGVYLSSGPFAHAVELPADVVHVEEDAWPEPANRRCLSAH